MSPNPRRINGALEKSRKTSSAITIYEQIIRDYPDTDQATEAAKRIRILTPKRK